MIHISNIHQSKTFTFAEAEKLLPLVYRITEESSKEVKYLMGCVEAMQNKQSDSSKDLETRINELIAKWQNKLERLGLRPKGLWLADFDNGTGYYCWKFPETQILYFHGYQDGFSGRIMIEKDHHENSPSPN